MPSKSFVTSYEKISNVLINEVHISKVFDDPPINFNHLEDPNCKKYKAIWDTGGNITVINKKVIEDCDLIPIGRTIMRSPGGENRSYLYLINLWLKNGLMIPNLRVVEGVLTEDVEVLIGMDIINLGDFAVSNKDGKTVFTFRYPSYEKIDFVYKS